MQTITEAREYLQQYRCIMGQIKRIREQIAQLRLDLLPASPDMSGMPHGGNKGDGLLQSTVELCCLESREQEMIKKADMIANDIRRTIEGMDEDRYVVVLMDRYLLRMSWDEISEKEGYSLRWAQILHGKALLSLVSSSQ